MAELMGVSDPALKSSRTSLSMRTRDNERDRANKLGGILIEEDCKSEVGNVEES